MGIDHRLAGTPAAGGPAPGGGRRVVLGRQPAGFVHQVHKYLVVLRRRRPGSPEKREGQYVAWRPRPGRQMIARRKPIIVSIYIFHDHGFHNRDLDNETKAILDAAQGIVFEDDRWIDEIQAYRRRGDECRVEMWVKVL